VEAPGGGCGGVGVAGGGGVAVVVGVVVAGAGGGAGVVGAWAAWDEGATGQVVGAGVDRSGQGGGDPAGGLAGADRDFGTGGDEVGGVAVGVGAVDHGCEALAGAAAAGVPLEVEEGAGVEEGEDGAELVALAGGGPGAAGAG